MLLCSRTTLFTVLNPLAASPVHLVSLTSTVAHPSTSDQVQAPAHCQVLKGLTHEHAFGPRAHEWPRLRLIATCHTVAGFLADAFNRQVAEAAPGLPRLEFLKVEIAQYTVEPGEGLPRTTITR